MYSYNGELVEQWLNEGRAAGKHLFFRFTAVWTAFNHWLTARYQKDGDGKLLAAFYNERKDFFKSLVRTNEELRDILAKLKKETPIYDERPGHRKETKQIQDYENIDEVFGVIYLARSNLIHGSKRFDAERDNSLIKYAYNALKIVVEELVIEKENN